MRKILEILDKKGIDLSRMQALDIFAREGDWQTTIYANKVKTIDVWEIDPIYEEKLRSNLPLAKIKITNSIREIKNKENFSKYDFIVVDNPQNCYGSNEEYCEHFDVIPDICRLLNKKGIIIFNINKEPFGFEKFPKWQERRCKFYEKEDTSKLLIPQLLEFYKKKFEEKKFFTKFCFNVSRNDLEHNDHLHYLVYSLEKS